MTPLRVTAICLALALASFFGYPGHTWLQQDTQIYVPIMQHQSDPQMLRNDLLAQHPHVAFTLYDEVTRTLRALTGQGWREVLAAQQIATRALGIWGFYLMALALGLGAAPSWLVAAMCALGAMITGPQVLSFEYEPTPRAFAVPLLFCAMGLTANRRYTGAAVAAAAAFLYHPPTALPFLALFLILAIKRPWPMAILAGAVAVLAAAAHGEPGQAVFGRLTAMQEQLQRMRTAYVWISTWHAAWIWHFVLLFAIAAAAFTRIKAPRELKLFLWGLPLLGLASMPVSYLLLEQWKWVLVPQVQPLRLLLFVTLVAQFLTAAGGVRAAMARRVPEAAAFLAVAFLISVQPVLTERAAWQAFWPPFRHQYPALHTAEIEGLAAWAGKSTPQDAVFLFPDAGHGLAPGIFRAEAERAVFVDWKSGGQVNYSKEFAEEWWARYQLTMTSPVDLYRYAALGISFIVLKPEHRQAKPTVFENTSYLVYRIQ